jgi:Holliday junction resolvase
MKVSEVVAAFAEYLIERGWDVMTYPTGNNPDVVAMRGAERLIAEAKGHGSIPAPRWTSCSGNCCDG